MVDALISKPERVLKNIDKNEQNDLRSIDNENKNVFDTYIGINYLQHCQIKGIKRYKHVAEKTKDSIKFHTVFYLNLDYNNSTLLYKLIYCNIKEFKINLVF